MLSGRPTTFVTAVVLATTTSPTRRRRGTRVARRSERDGSSSAWLADCTQRRPAGSATRRRLPVAVLRLPSAAHLDDAQLQDADVLVVDLPEEVEVPGRAAAHPGLDRKQVAGDIAPLRLAGGAIDVEVAHLHELVIAQIGQAVDLGADCVLTNDRVDVHAAAGLAGGRAIDLVAAIRHVEPRGPVRRIVVNHTEMVTASVSDDVIQ